MGGLLSPTGLERPKPVSLLKWLVPEGFGVGELGCVYDIWNNIVSGLQLPPRGGLGNYRTVFCLFCQVFHFAASLTEQTVHHRCTRQWLATSSMRLSVHSSPGR